MRNDNARWRPAQGMDRPAFSVSNIDLRLVRPRRQTLISGPYAKALALAGVKAATGWPDIASGTPYAVRLRRDRILLVDGPALRDGWHEAAGVAVSDMTDGYAVIELAGSGALSVLRRGTEISADMPSASVARGFGGYATLIYAFKAEDRFRLHLPRGFLEGFWALMVTYMEHARG